MNECPLQGSRRDLRPARPFGMDGLDAVAAALSHPDSLAAVVNPTDCDAPMPSQEKLVEILDMIAQDIRLTIQDKYIGKVSNSYDNKLQLVTAIKTHLQSLARDGLIEADFTVDIDLDSQRAWLESQGTPTVDLSDQQVRQANTGTQVFLVLDVKPIDAMEDVRVVIRV